MLASGGDPLQLTNDAASKEVDCFSPDGTQIYYSASFNNEELWSVPTLGGTPTRVVAASLGSTSAAVSADGGSLFFYRSDRNAIFRKPTSGLGEDLIYRPAATDLVVTNILPFPNGQELLVALGRVVLGDSSELVLEKVNLANHSSQRVGVRSMTTHRIDGRRGDPVRVGVVLEGVVALLALIAFIGALCGLLTWALVRLVTGFVS